MPNRKGQSTNRRSGTRGRRPNQGLMSSRNNNPLDQLVDLESSQRAAQLPRVRDKVPMVIAHNPIYTTTFAIALGTITPSLSADVINAYSFNISQAQLNAAWVAIFDLYRFLEIQVNFIPLNPSASQSPLYTAIDYDDAVPVSIAVLTAYETLQITAGPHMTTRTFTPRSIINAVVPTGAFSVSNRQWLDLSVQSTPFYGLKYGVPLLASGSATPQFSVNARCIVQLKNVR